MCINNAIRISPANFWRTEHRNMVKVSLVPCTNFKMRLGKLPKTSYIELFVHIFWIFKVFSSFISFGQSDTMLSRLLALLSHSSQCWDYRCVPRFPLSPVQTALMIFLWLCSKVESRLGALATSKRESQYQAKHSASDNRSILGGTGWFLEFGFWSYSMYIIII